MESPRHAVSAAPPARVSPRFTRSKAGLTLMELVVTISVISSMIGAILPAVQNIREATNATRVATDLHTLHRAAESYKQQTGAFPTEYGQLGAAGLIKAPLSTGLDDGYAFTLGPNISFIGMPIAPGITGNVIATINVDGKVTTTPVNNASGHTDTEKQLLERDTASAIQSILSENSSATDSFVVGFEAENAGTSGSILQAFEKLGNANGVVTFNSIFASTFPAPPEYATLLANLKNDLQLGAGNESWATLPGVNVTSFVPNETTNTYYQSLVTVQNGSIATTSGNSQFGGAWNGTLNLSGGSIIDGSGELTLNTTTVPGSGGGGGFLVGTYTVVANTSLGSTLIGSGVLVGQPNAGGTGVGGAFFGNGSGPFDGLVNSGQLTLNTPNGLNGSGTLTLSPLSP